MKKKIRYRIRDEVVETDVFYIPVRYIIAMALLVLETAAIIAIVVLLAKYVPYFYIALWLTEIGCAVYIIACDEAPDYKIPWLIVLLIPVVGVMLYLLFSNRKLKKKYVRRLDALRHQPYRTDSDRLLQQLQEESPLIATDARLVTGISGSHLFTDTAMEYFPLGEDMHSRLLQDLRDARQFIFMEYFIIEEGVFWNSILAILKEKAAAGVEVRIVYDDIGCMGTLPGNYYQLLRSFGIDAVPFSLLRGNADSEFNNRSHRKITVIDGRVGYTGGINIADEYINAKTVYGHWKDVGLRLEGEAVRELTKLFLTDYGINVRKLPEARYDYFPEHSVPSQGWVIPFGDGPKPIYRHRVGKTVIENLLGHAKYSFCAMTPYLIVDDAMVQAIENAALRGVKVTLILPGIPDKWLVKELAFSHYRRLMDAGVEIYEYRPGFVHAKVYLADNEVAMVGTINMDHRSLVHHFENGVWMYRCPVLEAIRADFDATLSQCVRMDEHNTACPIWRRALRAVLRIFAPML